MSSELGWLGERSDDELRLNISSVKECCNLVSVVSLSMPLLLLVGEIASLILATYEAAVPILIHYC